MTQNNAEISKTVLFCNEKVVFLEGGGGGGGDEKVVFLEGGGGRGGGNLLNVNAVFHNLDTSEIWSDRFFVCTACNYVK